MNGVDYANKINRQREVYQEKTMDNNRNHKEEVDSLKKTHELRESKRAAAHGDQLKTLEEGHVKSFNRIKSGQAEALKDKNRSYELALKGNQEEFHKIKRENIRSWDKKFSELKGNFSKSLSDTKMADAKVRGELNKNYKDNIKDIRGSASKNLNEYIANNVRGKEDSDHTNRLEKNQLIAKHQSDTNDLLQDQREKRQFLESTSIKDGQMARELATKRFVDGKTEQAKNFKKLTSDTDKRIDNEISKRDAETRKRQVAANKANNKIYKERYNELSNMYNKDVRSIEHQRKAEKISDSSINKEIQDKFNKNTTAQVALQRETLIREKNLIEESYGKRLKNTVDSYQNSMRDTNIAANERIKVTEAELTDINRKDKFEDRQLRERTAHNNQVALKYVEEKNASREADAKSGTARKIRTMKENFNKSLAAAQDSSQKSFEATKREMHADKRILEKRLHEQNSKENSFIKQVYNEKMEKMAEGYEKRIKALEIKNEMVTQSSADKVRDITRKTNFEIDRQNKAAKESAKVQVQTVREISHEKELSLKVKVKDLEQNFANKMNKQTMSNRKKIKDLQFSNTKDLAAEKTKFKDVMDQNNKFMAREFQRLKIASDTERQRLVSQYEDRINDLQRVYREKTNDTEQYNKLNKPS